MPPKLDELVVDEGELNRDLLAGILSPYVRLARTDGRPIFTGEFRRLSASQRTLVYLLARKAAISLQLSSGDASATPKEIADSTGVPHGTIKPVVIELVKKGMLLGEKGRYSVPSHALISIKEVFE